MLSKEYVISAYNILLGRRPESKTIIDGHLDNHKTADEFIDSLLASTEFLSGQLFFKVLTRIESMKEEILHVRPPNDSFNFQLIANSLDNSVTRMVKEQMGFYEPHVMDVMRRVIGPSFVCLDIGANIGALSVYMSHLCPEGNVYSFEPIKSTYKQLLRNVIRRDNVFTFNLALGDDNGTINMYYNPFMQGDSYINKKIKEEDDKLRIVELIRLDDWYRSIRPKSIDFIKLDVEGYEMEILKGGALIWEAMTPDLIIEIYPLALNRNNVKLKNIFCRLQELYSFIYHINKENYELDRIKDIISLRNSLDINQGIGDYYCSNKEC